MRLIDADALIVTYPVPAWFIIKVLDKAPTIDAVPVVRCRDCRFKADTIGKDEWCDLYEITVSGDHFCGDGRRA